MVKRKQNRLIYFFKEIILGKLKEDHTSYNQKYYKKQGDCQYVLMISRRREKELYGESEEKWGNCEKMFERKKG